MTVALNVISIISEQLVPQAKLLLQSRAHSVAYVPMRFWAFSGVIVLCLLTSVLGQTIDVKGGKEATASTNTPMFRPIVLGKGPKSLINRIDAQALIKGGQKDALVMFTCFVNENGKMMETVVYRPTPNSELLQQELKRKLIDAEFIPAIYKHTPVGAVYYGAVSFVVVQGKPRLRIFSNQEYTELKTESDFIGPQPIFGADSHFTGVHYPPAAAAQVPVAGIADIKLKVDENGNVEWMEPVGEHPPLVGFAAQALMDLDGTKFIPAFREGKPVSCEVTLPLYYPEP